MNALHHHSLLALVSLAALACAAVSAAAEEVPLAVPGTVNFQGRLAFVDSTGALKPLTGVQRVDFRLCDSATSDHTVWERQFPVTCTEDGTFNVTLDDGGAMLYPEKQHAAARLADAFQGNERHFELSVEGYGTLAPRLRVTSSPYAFQTQYAATAPGGFTVEGMLTVGGNATFKGNFSAVSGTISSNLTVASGGGTVKDLEVKGELDIPAGAPYTGLPVGCILAWTKDTVPAGWAVCDGSTTNGVVTPDLRARFVMGASSEYPAGSTGGAESVTLALDQMPDHQHEYPNSVAVSTKVSGGSMRAPGVVGDSLFLMDNDWEAHENRPPFYAVYYIMRVK